MSNHIEALRLIAARSQYAGGEAAILMNVRKSPVFQVRYNHIAARALNDPAAEWTQEEREIIVSAMGDGEQPADTLRTENINIRLTPTQKAHIQALAEAEELSVTEYILRRAGL